MQLAGVLEVTADLLVQVLICAIGLFICGHEKQAFPIKLSTLWVVFLAGHLLHFF